MAVLAWAFDTLTEEGGASASAMPQQKKAADFIVQTRNGKLKGAELEQAPMYAAAALYGASSCRRISRHTPAGTFWSPCGRRDEVAGRPRRLLVTSRTSAWVVPPPKVVFYREAPEAERSKKLQCACAEWAAGTSQRVPSTGFGGGCGATRCFGRGWARVNRRARGLPRRRRMGAKWEALGKRLAYA